MEQEGIVCPECSTANELGWSFCQQCGKRLPKPPDPQPTRDVQTPDSLRTVPEPQAAVDPGVVLKTVWQTPADHGWTTVAEESPVEAETVTEPPPLVITDAPVSAPPEIHKPPGVVDSPTVVVDAPSHLKPAIPSAQPESKPSPPPSPSPDDSKTEHVHSVSGVLCTQCGQSNQVGSAFCASCGAPMTFGKTMVMSSQAGPVKGRLHLVMEGGQAGEIYNLNDETVIGRAGGDITFPHDGFMSGRHARIVQRGNSFVLTDEGSRNGTFVKIKGEVELKPGDMILVGKQLFRFEV